MKSGLHREIQNNVTFLVENQTEFDLCSWVFIENVTKDTYYYFEELKDKRKGLEFWPSYPVMNIEEPASVSKEQ